MGGGVRENGQGQPGAARASKSSQERPGEQPGAARRAATGSQEGPGAARAGQERPGAGRGGHKQPPKQPLASTGNAVFGVQIKASQNSK